MHELFSKGLYNRQNMIEGMVIPNRVVLLVPFYSAVDMESISVASRASDDGYVNGVRYHPDAASDPRQVLDGSQTTFINNVSAIVKTLLMIGVKEIDIFSNVYGAAILDGESYRDESSILRQYAEMRPNAIVSIYNWHQKEVEVNGSPVVLVDAAMYATKMEFIRANVKFMELYKQHEALFDKANYLLTMASGYVIQVKSGTLSDTINLMYSEFNGSTGFTETIVARVVEEELGWMDVSRLTSEEKMDKITISNMGGILNRGVLDFVRYDSKDGKKYPFAQTTYSYDDYRGKLVYVDGMHISGNVIPREAASHRAKYVQMTRNLENYLTYDLNNLVQISTLLLCHIMVYSSKFDAAASESSVAYNCGEFLKTVKDTIFTRMFAESDLIVREKGKMSFVEKLNKLKINLDLVSKNTRRKFKDETMEKYRRYMLPFSNVSTLGGVQYCENVVNDNANYGVFRYNSCASLNFGVMTNRERSSYDCRNLSITMIGLGGIGWNFADYVTMHRDRSSQAVVGHIYDPNEKYDRGSTCQVRSFEIHNVYEYDELEVHNGSRLPVESKLLVTGMKKVDAYSRSKVVGDGNTDSINFTRARVDAELIERNSFHNIDCEDATELRAKYVVDCRDNIISEHIIPHTVFKASYDGGEYFSFFTLPKATAHMSFDINPEATAYQVIPSYYVTPAIISVVATHLLSYDVIRDLVEKALAYNSENYSDDKYLSDLRRHSIDQEFCITDLIRQCAYGV